MGDREASRRLGLLGTGRGKVTAHEEHAPAEALHSACAELRLYAADFGAVDTQRLLAISAALIIAAAPAACADDRATATGKEPVAGADYLADRPRENPVYISDQIPRELPSSAAPGIVRTAKRTGVTT